MNHYHAIPRRARRYLMAEAELLADIRRGLVHEHLDGDHYTKEPGCPYCYPPGPNGDYRP